MNSYNDHHCGLHGKVSVQGVVALGGHFETCQELDFYESFFYYQFSKRKDKYFVTFNHSYSEKSSNRAI